MKIPAITRNVVLLLLGSMSCFAQARLVNSVGNFIHNVADLDRSVRFYRDVLGMDMPRPPGDWLTADAVPKLYNAVGAKYRVGNAQIPGSPMRVELAEFQGVEHHPVRRKWGVAGTSVLMLTVVDLSPVLERVKNANVPVPVRLHKACDGRGIVVQDPDGFAVMLVERGGAAVGGSGNFTGMRFGYLVSGDALEKGPFAALALPAQKRAKASCEPVEDALLNAHGLGSIVTIPGGFEVWLVPGKAVKDKGKHEVRPRDPGAAVLRLAVSDIDAAVQVLAQAQVRVVSEGGVIQTLPPAGLRAAILRAPDDLLIQVLKQ